MRPFSRPSARTTRGQRSITSRPSQPIQTTPTTSATTPTSSRTSERTMLGRRSITSRPSQPIPTTPTTSATTRTSQEPAKGRCSGGGVLPEGYRRRSKPRNNLGNYANFLKNQRKDDARAEEYYLKALAADPKDADFSATFANFLKNQRKDDARAEEYYLKAIAADPNHANNLGNYAVFSREPAQGRRAGGGVLPQGYRRRSQSRQQLGNYAVFLETSARTTSGAEEYYLKAIAADPITPTTSATTPTSSRTSERMMLGRRYYLKALAADPNDANHLGNYANFLKTQRKDDARAEEYYLKAIARSQPRQPPRKLRNFSRTSARRTRGRRSITSRPSPPIPTTQPPRKLRELPQEPAQGGRAGGGVLPQGHRRQSQPRQQPRKLRPVLDGCGRFDEAAPFAKRAWEKISDGKDLAVGEVAFSRWLLAAVTGKDGASALGRLKTLLQAGYSRYPWDFDSMLATCIPKLTEGARQSGP